MNAMDFIAAEADAVFTFDKLNDRAKERARDWLREDYPEHGWWDSSFDDFEAIAGMMGITLSGEPVRLMGGNQVRRPAIFFSGFWSQGDGACFEGSWSPEKNPIRILDQILDHAPQDEALHEIALTFAELSERCGDVLDSWVRVRTSAGHYHSGTISIEFEIYEDHIDLENEVRAMTWDAVRRAMKIDDDTFERDMLDAMRSFADWMYVRLRDEYEYLTSDEQIDEMIEANEYVFDEDGNSI